MARAVVVGAGAVGARVARLLLEDPTFTSVGIVHRDSDRVAALTRDLGPRLEVLGTGLESLFGPRRGAGPAGPTGPAGAEPLGPRRGAGGPPWASRGALAALDGADVTVLAAPVDARQAGQAALAAGSHLVSTVDDPAEVRALLSLDSEARERRRVVVAGAAMAPGLSGVLAGYARRWFDRVDEIRVASVGTGGPACARRHHAALRSLALDWHDGAWRRRPGGSGRELVWFPEPVGGADCYRAGLADPLLLVAAFPDCRRVAARLQATRRDRVSSWLPMLRPPHPEGLVGAVRVEVRGWCEDRAETRILGVTARPAQAAAAVSARAARWAVQGRLARAGSGGLAELVPVPGELLRDLADDGIRAVRFEGHDPYAEHPAAPITRPL